MKQRQVKQPARRGSRTVLALALALASGAASALGLGQIEVKSRIGQPFLAEIPIVSNDPSELENLQAELASPLVFARIGLQPPTGIVSELRFSSALDSSGRPVIRVTSEQPVNDSLLTFLVSVDWGQGRLVREYSALLDTPRTVSAPLQPQIEETVVSAPNIVERPLEPEVAATPADAPTEAAPAEESVAAGPDSDNNADANAIPPTPTQAAEPASAPAQVASVAPAAAPAGDLAGEYSVRRGDTLSQIAGRVQGEGFTLDQTMIALLRANPEAFIGGNVNRLKAGAVLAVPASEQLASVDAAQASQLVSSQVRQWRDARRAVPQPALEAGIAASAATSPVATGATAAAANPRSADARLEIVPPGASSATQAGDTQSGINAGGEGDMLRQELQQNTETLAAREAELQELKGRVAELEQLQSKQQQLIAMKDSELAAAQQRLAQSNQKDQAMQVASAMPWLIGGGVLLLVVAGGWFLRRRPVKPVFRAPLPGDAAAAPSIADSFTESSFPAQQRAPVQAEADLRVEEEPAVPVLELQWASAPAAATAPAPSASAPAWHVASADTKGRVEPSMATQPGQERLELARAYLDLGDRESARQLLAEVVINGDLSARQRASRMLQELD
ncbi:LysM peptidoglycan-binding domain-containing protein [Lysobacter sp. S4-A87]|uniref:type IV pilus assembly protein FimV n=1 Tax=Lysobacter sp. S4-A87 TaxID=2925843 RepID=UPI001F52D1AB|nr:FimV/HubP family polar landmark protein [Lysobacter sp. S4-A87]UNK50207.1 LysM peptidoglycan-binding domain-containing protein [Lysobacter sp. S4-A87]